MNRNTSKLVKILVSLFALNSLTLYFYFSSDAHHHHPPPPPPPPRPHPINHHQQQQQLSKSKPWPMLPSYLPWSSSQNPDVKIHSCEAYFGNGFQTRLDLLNSSSPAATGGGGSGGGGWFRCFYSETLRSSVCEGGKVKMNVGKIRMSRGGERLEEVIGRTENEEMPVFEDGAFEVEVNGDGKLGRRLVSDEFLDSYVPEGEISLHTMRDLLRSIRVVDPQPFDDCEQWVEEPTLLVTRFEYANLFHTVTDWYSAYVSSRVTGLPNRPHVVFVDGHCKTQLEEMWDALFSSIRYAKNFSRSVCFRHAVLSPLGYETPLFKGLSTNINCQGAASARDLWRNPDDRKTARLSEFGEMIRVAFGFQVVNRHQTEKSESSHHNVLFVRREDYLAHPRHAGKVQARLSNEQEVFDSIQRWVSDHPECKINLVNGLFAHMSMKEQVKHIQDASVIIGAHGAGLTHIVSAAPKTVILEIISSQFRRPHFQLISQWKGLEYHAINLDGSYANPAVVIDKLSDIMTSLGCRSFQHGR